jgi:hypothetical protein
VENSGYCTKKGIYTKGKKEGIRKGNCSDDTGDRDTKKNIFIQK